MTAATLLAVTTGCGAPPAVDRGQAANPVVEEALQEEGEIEILDTTCCESSLFSEIMLEVYTRAGATAKITKIADMPQHFPLMAANENAISPSIADFTAPAQMKKYVDEERSVIKEASKIASDEGWYVPTYVIKGDPERGIEPTCPGLPNWEALNECAAVFSTAETEPRGAFLTAGPEWAKYYGDEDRIKNLNLNYDIVFTGSDAALTAAIKRAYDRGEPFVALAWKPHYVTLKHDLTRVEFPPYSEECWGTTYACNWPPIILYKLASARFPDTHPTGYQIYLNADLNDADVESMMIAVEEQGKTPAQAAAEWLDANPERWQSWLPSNADAK